MFFSEICYYNKFKDSFSFRKLFRQSAINQEYLNNFQNIYMISKSSDFLIAS